MKVEIKLNNFRDTMLVKDLFVLGFGYDGLEHNYDTNTVTLELNATEDSATRKVERVLELMRDIGIKEYVEVETDEGDEV